MKKTTAPRKKPTVKAGTSKQAAIDRKKAFVEAYITNGGNATAAAKTAGYSVKTAGSQGQRLLKDVEISTQIAKRQDALAEKHELTTDSVIAELSKIVHVDPRQLFNEDGTVKAPGEWSDRMAGAIASVEVLEEYEGQGKDRKFVGYTKKVKFWDKNSAIDKAMKHLGLFEKDNEQKTGALAGLPPDILKAIAARLKALKNARPGLAG